jgi:acid phosphatase (class A)
MGFAGTFLAYGVASADEPPTGYLAVRARPDLVKILPPPPDPGSARWRADMQAFRQSRSLRDTARWQRATADADEAPAALERDFSCAAGRVLSGPALTRLLSRIAADEDATTEPAKLHWARPRPFVGNDEPICVPRTAKIAASPDYPSGHSTLGWSVALTLAEMLPDRASAILQRGRDFGDSRLVCGVHSGSAVDAGRGAGASLVAALHAVPAYRADMAAARQELDKQPAPTSSGCDEQATILHP